MKKFNVIVNGTSYEVAVEELAEGEVVKPVATQAPATQAPKAAPPTGGTSVTSPMPGNIWKVLVKEGQTVQKGDVLVILEAMKMENEIFAPVDGVITSLNVAESAAVDTDELICTIVAHI